MSRDRLAELNSPSRPRARQSGRSDYIPLRDQNASHDDHRGRGYDEGRYSSGRISSSGGASAGRRMAPPPARNQMPRQDYRSGSRGSGSSNAYAPPAKKVNIPPQPASTVESMDIFFAEITTINDLLKEVKDNVNRLEDLQSGKLEEEAYGDVSGMSRKLQRQMDNISEETRIIMDALKTRIKAIELENVQLPPNHPNMAMRTSQHGQAKKKFMDFLLMYNDVQREYSTMVKRQVEDQIRVVNPDFTDEEVQQAVEDQMEGRVFAQQMASQGGRYAESSAALREVQARQNEMAKIEQTIVQLSQLFTEMSTLVEAQGQTIATIEQYVENTEQYTEQAVVEIEQAVETAKKVRSRKWQLLLCCVLLLIVAGLLLYFFVLRDIINGSGGAGNRTTSSPTARPRALVQKRAGATGAAEAPPLPMAFLVAPGSTVNSSSPIKHTKTQKRPFPVRQNPLGEK